VQAVVRELERRVEAPRLDGRGRRGAVRRRVDRQRHHDRSPVEPRVVQDRDSAGSVDPDHKGITPRRGYKVADVDDDTSTERGRTGGRHPEQSGAAA
jgi:hypothetical protein